MSLIVTVTILLPLNVNLVLHSIAGVGHTISLHFCYQYLTVISLPLNLYDE